MSDPRAISRHVAGLLASPAVAVVLVDALPRIKADPDARAHLVGLLRALVGEEATRVVEGRV